MEIDLKLLDYLIAIVFTMFGFVVKTLWQAVKDLQQSDVEISAKLNAIEVLVAGDYVKRDAFESSISALFQKLDKLSDQQNQIAVSLSSKVDRSE